MSEQVEIDIKSVSGEVTGKRELPASLFSVSAPDGLLNETVRWQRNRRRAGTHACKTRSDVAGGGAKPWRQKGTGRARAGTNSSPIWVGGGVCHGPKPKSYSFRMNKRQRKMALKAALSARVSEGSFMLLDELGFSEIKAKSAREALTKLGISAGDSTLVIIDGSNEVAEKSFRNLDQVQILNPSGLNAEAVIRHQYLVVIGEATLSSLESRLSR